jgi:hypothetical protein
VDVLTSPGQSVAEAVRATGVTEVTCHRWRQGYGGLTSVQVRRMRELENQRRRAVADLAPDRLILAEAARGNHSVPRAGAPVSSTSKQSRPSPSAALGQHRSASTARREPQGAAGRDEEAALTADIIALAREHGRRGCRKIPALLHAAGWVVSAKRVGRIWRREGLKVPAKQPKKGRLWLADGSRVRLRPERRNHVWVYDLVEDRTHDGRKLRRLDVVDGFTPLGAWRSEVLASPRPQT